VFLVVSVFFTISVVLIVEPPREPFGGIFDHTITGINGENIHLSQYHHKVILVVNVASTSSLTDVNYRGLQKLHDLYGKNGLVVIGFPTNEFGGQEETSAQEIKSFLDRRGITFIVAQKTQVNGSTAHPVYQYIHSHYPEAIQDDFEKILFDKNGIPFRRYGSSVVPHDISNDIIKLLYTT